MPISFKKSTIRRQENKYQNQRTKAYLEKQAFLKSLQTHSEALPKSVTSQRTPATWQQVLLLSSLFALMPNKAQANSQVSSSNNDGHIKALTATGYSNHVPASNTIATTRSSLINNPQRCHTVLNCFTDFLKDAGPIPRTQFAHLLHKKNSDLNAIRTQLRQTFPSASAEEIHAAHPIKKSHRRRHLDDTNEHTFTTAIPSTSTIDSLASSTLETIDLYTQTKERLSNWVNITQTQTTITSPTSALGAVLNHYDAVLPSDFLFFLDSQLLDNQDMRLIDEAAQLYQQTYPHLFPLSEKITSPLNNPNLIDKSTPPIDLNTLLRKHFLDILLPDLKKETLLQTILTPVINGTDTDFYFDGIALQGAFGKTFETLLNSPTLKLIPAFVQLDKDKQREILQEKFSRLGEDTTYPIGTTAQSLASTVQRILKYQKQNINFNFDNEKLLFETFHEIEQRWEAQRDYPLHPRLLFAEHLAHASNVRIESKNWEKKLWEQEYLPLFLLTSQEIKSYHPPSSSRATQWLASYFAHWNKDGRTWSTRGESIKNTAIASLFNHLKDIAQTYYIGLPAAEIKNYIQAQKYIGPSSIEVYKTSLENLSEKIRIQSAIAQSPKKLNWLTHRRNVLLHSIHILEGYIASHQTEKAKQAQANLINQISIGEIPLPSGQPPDLIIWLAKHMAETVFNKEIITRDDWQSHAVTVLQYANNRLLANYGNSPLFDRVTAAFSILKRYDLTDAQITTPRQYTIQSENMHLTQTKRGSLLDEFLERADWSGLTDKQLYFEDANAVHHHLHPQNELQEAEEKWNNDLPLHPWVQARARENLRLKNNVDLSQAIIQIEAQRIAKNYLAETENHRQLMVGLETWINTIPVIGPIYNIEEGIRHKEATQIILGSLFLALDAFDFATQGRSPASTMAEEVLDSTAIRIPPIEHITVSSTHHITEELGIPLADFSPSISSSNNIATLINTDPWKISLSDSNVPIDYRSLAARVRTGEEAVKWIAPNGHEFDVIYITNEDRIIPTQQVGGKFHEVSWEDGHILHNKRLIHYDTQTKIYFSSAGLKGGVRRSGDYRIDGERLSKRYTPEKLTAILSKARDTKMMQSIATHFSQNFPITFENPSSSTFPAHAFYTEIYSRSPTFRRIANHFFKSEPPSSQSLIKWQINICNRNRPYTSHLNIARLPHQSIYIPDDAHIANLHYLGVDTWHTFTREQIYLDAVLSAMTGHPDFIAPMQPLTRGPNIALRDRILFEAGHTLPQQTSYSRVTTAELESNSYDAFNPNHETYLASANEVLTLENNYIDPLFNEKIALNPETEVLGTPIKDRYTIRQLKHIQESLLNLRRERFSDNTSFADELNRCFNFQGISHSPKDITEFIETYQYLYRHSSTFRQLWLRANFEGNIDLESQWHFVTDPLLAEKDLPLARQHSTVNLLTKTIYIIPDDIYYLSDIGFVPVEIERKLTHAMLNILTRAHEPNIDIWTNRGALVHLAEKILSEADFNLPKRLAYGLVTGEQISTGQFRDGIDPRIYQATAQRVRDIEENYIRSRAFKIPRSISLSSSDTSYPDLQSLSSSARESLS